ncbi:M20 family metallo-hydrolase [Streptomyces xinghaiensis]|uniref:M20 family metallo-hydrolase n=1 Tax=Streptomyces TaxID=1883 RepID=UPI000AC98D80|nr:MULTISPECIES: M20 family metallo-hydrolase [Streptomyces]
MTTPEENREKTTSTDDVTDPSAEETAERTRHSAGSTMREALEEAGLSPDDFREER